MISAEHALKDYEDIVKKSISADEKLVEISRILIKLLLSIRTNQISTQKGYNIVNNRKEKKETPEA
jgi:hypothetical protein